MFKGRIKKQVLQFNITTFDSNGNERTFTVLGAFKGVIDYDLKDISIYPDEIKWESKCKLNIESDDVKVFKVE